MVIKRPEEGQVDETDGLMACGLEFCSSALLYSVI